MAKTNSTARLSVAKLVAMRDDLNSAAKILNGATGFLFAAQMPNGEIKWIAGGDLLSYDSKTASAAMRLYIEAQRLALKAA